jgi:hypothetical protein
MMKQTLRDVKGYIIEMTSEMDCEAYIEFMRELSEWASSQADLQEYNEESMFNE